MNLSALAILLCTISTSCASLQTYAEDRVADLADCFAFMVAPGTADPLSIAAGVELSSAPVGLGLAQGKAYGMVGRHVGRTDFELANPSFVYILIDYCLEELLNLPGADHRSGREATVQLHPQKARGRNPERHFRIGAHVGLSVFFVYADVEVGEIFDFVLGIFGVDFMQDDSIYAQDVLDQAAATDEPAEPRPHSRSDPPTR